MTGCLVAESDCVCLLQSDGWNESPAYCEPGSCMSGCGGAAVFCRQSSKQACFYSLPTPFPWQKICVCVYACVRVWDVRMAWVSMWLLIIVLLWPGSPSGISWALILTRSRVTLGRWDEVAYSDTRHIVSHVSYLREAVWNESVTGRSVWKRRSFLVVRGKTSTQIKAEKFGVLWIFESMTWKDSDGSFSHAK